MPMSTPTLAPNHPPSREQLLYWLHEAAEIEHHLMCCYLYAAFSLKRVDAHWNTEQAAAVQRWREAIMSVVFEEMSHLALVGNLANALGAAPNVSRPPFPVDAGPYPAGFVIRLQPFSAATIEHFKFLERPSNQALVDADGFTPQRQYRRVVPEGRLSPGPRDYDTVGELYEVLAQSLDACAAALGDAVLFCGDPALQVDASLAPLPGMIAVTDLRSARQAIETIVTQGEGAGDEEHDSHFCRFTRIGEELAAMTAADPSFEPAWPAATNPVMNAPIHSAAERVHISEPRIARWLDIGNAMYTTSLRCLLQGFGARERRAKATWLAASFALMRALVPVGQGLANRPATALGGAPHAGLSFTPLRTLAPLPPQHAAAFVAERLSQLRERAIELPLELVAGESAATWLGVVDLLAAQQAALLELAGNANTAVVAAAATTTTTATSAAIVTPAPAASTIEVAKGQNATILFNARRCIHSRHCVLDAPSVFKANTPGEWIYPDTVAVASLVAVAHNCPSGAIRYQRHDGGADEAAPAVNQLRIRENGPYAVHAPLTIAGADDGFRATLCRCGQSNNKPWCDGSHAAAGFIASGEPRSGAVDALDVRDGPLAFTPLKNGPLQMRGNLEICAGTGRTVARVTEAKLCRCGQSKNKPFCDLSHLAAGFVADGS
jgi:CDGSH-type Zn-finger protein/uncharacterized Fe-S cluster protein YjdI